MQYRSNSKGNYFIIPSHSLLLFISLHSFTLLNVKLTLNYIEVIRITGYFILDEQNRAFNTEDLKPKFANSIFYTEHQPYFDNIKHY